MQAASTRVSGSLISASHPLPAACVSAQPPELSHLGASGRHDEASLMFSNPASSGIGQDSRGHLGRESVRALNNQCVVRCFTRPAYTWTRRFKTTPPGRNQIRPLKLLRDPPAPPLPLGKNNAHGPPQLNHFQSPGDLSKKPTDPAGDPAGEPAWNTDRVQPRVYVPPDAEVRVWVGIGHRRRTFGANPVRMIPR